MWLEHFIVHLLNHWSRRPFHEADGLLLGSSRDGEHGAARRVLWPNARRAEHCCIVGKTGSGKTHCMEWLASQLMVRSEPFVFIDYHGDATNHLTALAAVHPEAEERLVVIDLGDPHRSAGINPLETTGNGDSFGRASELASILRQRWQVDSFGARTEELLRNVLFALATSGHTLLEAPLLLTSQDFRVQVLADLRNADCLHYWRERFEPLSEGMKSSFREPLLNKITGFLTEPSCRHFLGQQQSSFNFTDAIEQGRWVLICLPKGVLREHAHTLGNLVFARLQFEILARTRIPEDQRRLVTVFADEVQNLAENDLTTLLTEGRKFRVSLVTGNQHWAQLSPDLRGALLAAGTQIFFRTSAADASVLAAELSVNGRSRYQQVLTELPRGQALARIGGQPAVQFSVPPLPDRASPRRAAQLRDLSVALYARGRAEIEHDIQARRQDLEHSPRTLPLTPLNHDYEHGQHSW